MAYRVTHSIKSHKSSACLYKRGVKEKFPRRNAGGKGSLNPNLRKLASGRRGSNAFYGETIAPFPGHGIRVLKEKSIVSQNKNVFLNNQTG
jgi:hypothetical protein